MKDPASYVLQTAEGFAKGMQSLIAFSKDAHSKVKVGHTIASKMETTVISRVLPPSSHVDMYHRGAVPP
jgi:hypothetical protein